MQIMALYLFYTLLERQLIQVNHVQNITYVTFDIQLKHVASKILCE